MTTVLSAGSPMLWYLNRGTGFVLLGLLTATLLLGVLSAGRRGGGRVPTFVNQYLHRYLSVLAVVLLAGHVAAAVADEYVDIRWYDAVLPWGSAYEPLWMAFGAVAFDLVALVMVTSLLRGRISPRAWRLVHLTAYLAWGTAVVHGIGIGTDSSETWARRVTIVCCTLVGLALLLRLVLLAVAGRRRARGRADLRERLVTQP